MKKYLRRATAALVFIILAIYVLALGNIWLNESAIVFVGAYSNPEKQFFLSDQISIPWDTVRVTTEDGIRILLWESRQTNSPAIPWVIYFYGQRGQLADKKNLAMYDLFHSMGLNVLAVEYRGYGASEQTEPTETGVYSDARAAWRHLNETRGVLANQVVLYGYSLGGGVAIQTAMEISPAGLITEGAFTSFPAAVRSHYPWLPAELVMRNRFANLEKAKSLPLPWLLLHGRQDIIVPFEHAQTLAGTTDGQRRLVVLECGHEDAIKVQSEPMRKALREFIQDLFELEHGV
jgi:pimeloyl-ACP methyl ester carboxylesterase